MSEPSEYSDATAQRVQSSQPAESPEAATIRSLERRSLWLGIGLGAALFLLVLGVVSALLLYSEERKDRRAEAARRNAEVEHEAAVSLGEAHDLFEQQARPVADRPEQWQPALNKADDALKRAENVLKVGDAKDELKQKVQALRADVDLAKKGQDLANQLDAVRLRRPDASVGPQQAKEAADTYAAVFKEHGIDARVLDVPLSVKKIQVLQNHGVILDGLLDWADVTPSETERAKLFEVVSTAEADQLLKDVVRGVVKHDRPGLTEMAKAEIARSFDPPPRPAWAYRRLADGLVAVGATDEAVAVLRKSQAGYPQDFWLNYTLGVLLRQDQGVKGRTDALRFLTAAAALRGPSAQLYNHLGLALRATGEVGEAINAFEIARRQDGQNVAVLNNLGTARLQIGEVDSALDLFTIAESLDPKRMETKINKGSALQTKNELDLAIRTFNEALAIDPNSAIALTYLGLTLEAKGDLDGAVEAHLKALKIDPKSIPAHNNLGNAQLAKGDVDDALHTFEEALKINPRYAPSYLNLGEALRYKGDLDGAMRAFQSAIDLTPRDAGPHEHLGFVLSLRGDLDGAIREYRTAVELNPRSTAAYLGLTRALVEKRRLGDEPGHLLEAIAILADGLKHIETKNNARVKQQYEEYKSWERILDEAKKGENDHLTPVLTEKERLNSAEEMLVYARLCLFYKHLYNNATKFYADAFGIRPELANDLRLGHRFDAACAAALAGNGEGKDVASFTAIDRQTRREQARRWLAEDLALWTKLAASDKPMDRAQTRAALLRWKQERHLAGVRDKDALAKLSENERAVWQKLWDDVDALMSQLRQKKQG